MKKTMSKRDQHPFPVPPQGDHKHPWLAANKAGLEAAVKNSEEVLVAWHDGWRPARILEYAPKTLGGAAERLVLETASGGVMSLGPQTIRTSVLTRTEDEAVPF